MIHLILTPNIWHYLPVQQKWVAQKEYAHKVLKN